MSESDAAWPPERREGEGALEYRMRYEAEATEQEVRRVWLHEPCDPHLERPPDVRRVRDAGAQASPIPGDPMTSAATKRRWTLAWYRGRVRYELRWFPHGAKQVLRGESRWYAPIRCLWHALVLMYEAEICEVCGHPVAAVWHAEDALWMKVNGSYGGTTCVSCFNRKARAAGTSPYWEVRDGEFPTCTGSPCVHVAPMLVQAAESATDIASSAAEAKP